MSYSDNETSKDDYHVNYDNNQYENNKQDDFEDDEEEYDDQYTIFDIISDLKKDLQDYFYNKNPNIGEKLKYQDLFDFVDSLRN
jgi:hypothetical protein